MVWGPHSASPRHRYQRPAPRPGTTPRLPRPRHDRRGAGRGRRVRRTRTAFGRPIGGHQLIQQFVADIVMARKQSELVVFDAAWREASDADCHQEANVAKVVTSEHAVASADRGIQVLGGIGISAETHCQRFWRDVRQFRIAPLSNEVARTQLAESYGLPRSY